MSDSNQAPDFAQMLAGAAPVSNENQPQDVNLSSSYLGGAGDSQGGAFISNGTIADHIADITENAEEAMNFAKEYGFSTEKYDPRAEEKAKAAAEAEAKRVAEENEKNAKAAAQKAASDAKKEEIRKFLNGQSEKDRKLGYSRGVISGILFSFGIVIVALFVGAKWFRTDMVKISTAVDSYVNGNTELVSIHILTDKLPQDIKLTSNETINHAIKLNDVIDFGESVIFNYTSKLLNGQDNNNIAVAPTPIDNTEPSIDIEETKNTEENIIEEQAPEFTYSLIYTENESEANRVISANCNSLSCGDYSQASDPSEIVFCNEFSMKDTLGDTETRIGRSGKCRYKDSSELAILSIE